MVSIAKKSILRKIWVRTGENVKLHLGFCENDLYWDDNELVYLFSKEKEALLGLNPEGVLMVARREAIEWMLRAIAHYGFSMMTTILAVNIGSYQVFSFREIICHG